MAPEPAMLRGCHRTAMLLFMIIIKYGVVLQSPTLHSSHNTIGKRVFVFVKFNASGNDSRQGAYLVLGMIRFCCWERGGDNVGKM